MPEPSVLVVRDDGVIVVPGAIPLGRDWIAGLERFLDTASAMPRPKPLIDDRRDPPK